MRRTLTLILMLGFAAGSLLMAQPANRRSLRIDPSQKPLPIRGDDEAVTNRPLVKPHTGNRTGAFGPGKVLMKSEYDFGSNGGVLINLIDYGDGTLAVARMGATLPGTTADRGTFFSYFNGTSWSSMKRVEVGTERRGWSNLGALADGRSVTVSHVAHEVNVDAQKGLGIWTSTITGFATATPARFPRLTIDGKDQIIICSTYAGTLNEVINPKEVAISRDRGATWSYRILFPETTRKPAFTVDDQAIDSFGNKVAIAVAELGGDVHLWESTDNGMTWTYRNVTNYPNDIPVGAESIRPWPVCDLIYDNSGNVHIFFEAVRAIQDVAGTSIELFDDVDVGIQHWSQTAGITQVVSYSDIPGADSDALLFAAGNPFQQINAYNTLTGQPQAGVDAAENLYVLFCAFRPNDLDTDSTHFTDLYAVGSRDGGVTWSKPPVNVTDTPKSEDLWASLADNVRDSLRFVYQSDDNTGNSVQGGGAAPTTFLYYAFPKSKIINSDPDISIITPVSSQPEGQPILVQANITDDTGIASATLSHRRGGDASFSTVLMSLSGSVYQATIPASSVTSRGVEYFITATDLDGAQTREPAPPKIISIPIIVSNLAKPTEQPAAGEQRDQTAYRLISIPFQLNDPSAKAVLEDDLGPYDPIKWRLFDLKPGVPVTDKKSSDVYVEFSDPAFNGKFEPGKSLFLIVRDANKFIDSGPGQGQTVKTDQKFKITLLSGHNFITTPFNFVIPEDKLQLASDSAIPSNALQTYDRGWKRDDKLSPWEGYYFANNRSTTDTLLVNPDLSSGSPLQMANKAKEGGWRIRILGHCGEAADTYNFAGVAPGSEDGWDDNDLAEPPPIGEYVSLYFPHPEWQKVLDRYSDDIRSPATPNHRWDFVVESNIRSEIVALQFDGLQKINEALAVFLVDDELTYKQNLRENAVYQYQARGLGRSKQLTLLVGKEAFISEQTAGIAGVPENFVLGQNFPNPFWVGATSHATKNSETMIRFGLPVRSVVTIKIFDLVGREVATVLENVELPAGRHQRLWDGRDAQGRAVVSGIYFYRLVVGSFTKTMKMAVMR